MGLIPAHGDSRGIALLAVCGVFWILAAVAVCARIWSRRLKKLTFVLNDYSIFVALLFASALVAIVMAAVFIGAFGQHSTEASPGELIFMAKILIVGQVLWAFANLAIKISILHLYTTIFWTHPVYFASYTIMGLATCLCVIITLSALLLCRPISYNWDRNIKGTCGDSNKSFLAQAVINLCIDLAIVIIPIPVLWNLQMRPMKKLGLYFMFSVGIGICVITALRISAIHKLDPTDITYTAVDFGIYNIAETLLGIFNACLPVTRPVFQKLSSSEYLQWTQCSICTSGHDSDSQNQWHWAVTPAKSYSHGPGKRSTQKVDDAFYPLGNIASERQKASVETSAISNESLADVEAHPAAGGSVKVVDTIRTIQGWNANSSIQSPNLDERHEKAVMEGV